MRVCTDCVCRDRFVLLQNWLSLWSGRSGRRSGPKTCEGPSSQLSSRGEHLVLASLDVEVHLHMLPHVFLHYAEVYVRRDSTGNELCLPPNATAEEEL